MQARRIDSFRAYFLSRGHAVRYAVPASERASEQASEAIITRHYNVGTLIIVPAELSRDLLDLVKSGNLYNAKCRRRGTFDPE